MKLNILVEDIIKNYKVSNQVEVKDILFQKYNKNVTQSNISRILKQINAVKVMENGKFIYQIRDKLVEVSSWAKKLMKKIDDNGFVIIIISYSGSASIIGQVIDEKNVNNIMGTIAGDNSLLVIPKDVSKIKQLRKDLEILFDM